MEKTNDCIAACQIFMHGYFKFLILKKICSMKPFIMPVIILMLLLLLNIYGCNNKKQDQYFSGEVAYSYTYESSTLNTESLTKERPMQSILRYGMNGYQSQFIGKDTVPTIIWATLTGVYRKTLQLKNLNAKIMACSQIR